MSADELYLAVAEVVRRVRDRERSLRSAVYEHPYANKKKLLRLACETVRFKDLFDGILEDKALSRSLLSEPFLAGNVPLVNVLLYEFLVGNGLNQASQRFKRPIFSRAKDIHDREKMLSEENRGVQALKNNANKQAESKIEIPRYARINTLKWSIDEAIQTLKEEDWKVSEFAEGENFVQRVARLKSDEVFIDPHVPELLVFPNANNFHTYWMVEQRYLILQDKASCLPAFLLAPPPGSFCLDACAAPGNKTSHLAAIVGCEGVVFAFDRAADRVKTMKQLLRGSGADNAVVECADFLKTDLQDERWNQVNYAVVDPPCSGSGMVKRMDEWTGGNGDQQRLSRLANLQAMLLKHALRLPALQRLVYSTCSVHEEENEAVVEEALKELGSEWKLSENVLPSWTLRGLDSYEWGKHCLRADPKVTLTNGFFVAVFERKSAQESGQKQKKLKKMKRSKTEPHDH